MIPRTLKTCLGCGKPKMIYGKGYCQSCYPKFNRSQRNISPNVKAQEHKKKDYRLSQSYAFERAYYIWDGKNFITGEKMPKNEVCYDNFAHVLAKKMYEYFRYYPLGIVLLTHDQHFLYDNFTQEGLIKRLKQFPHENWEKLFNYSYQLISEYDEWGKDHWKEYRI